MNQISSNSATPPEKPGPFDEIALAFYKVPNIRRKIEVYDFATTYHPYDPAVASIMPLFRSAIDFWPSCEDFLKAVSDKNSSGSVRGPALYHLAKGYALVADLLEFTRTNGLSISEYAQLNHNREFELFGATVLDDWFGRFSSSTPGSLREMAFEFATKAADKFSREKIYVCHRQTNDEVGKTLIATVGRACASLLYQIDNLSIGKPMPSDVFVDLNDVAVSFQNRGGNAAILDFWMLGCGPCLKKVPYLEELHRKHESDSLEIIGLNVGKDASELASFISKNKITFRNVCIHPRNRLLKRWGISAFPTILIVDREGNLYAKSPNMSSDLIELCIGNILS